ncbi:MAG: aminodeoxychorismate lyase [Dethiosulfovibrio peptidovorans]|nr:MAG: aminodeoxychorismate lyase [Dethiosulfovibrio peptidovorans]
MKRFFLSLAFLAVVLGGWATWHLGTSFWTDLLIMPFRNDAPVDYHLPPGQSASVTATELVRLGVAVHRRSLVWWMVHTGVDRKLRPGLYSLSPGASWQVAAQLGTQEPTVWPATIVPGTDLEQYYPFDEDDPSADRLAPLSDDAFPGAMVPLLPLDVRFRAAYLLPETYLLPEKSPRVMVALASRGWWRRFDQRVAGSTSADLFQAAVVASLVERESLRDEERPRVAGVILNRLRLGMPLQIDATVVYAWKLLGRTIRRVTYDDLKVDSPYNTYRIGGLPPGPICIPSAPSWEAALNPESHDYLYYVADGSGAHRFSRSYEEHRRAIRSIRMP